MIYIGFLISEAAHSPRRPILVNRVVMNRLATDDRLRKSGLSIVSHCCFCMNAFETIPHLFFDSVYSEKFGDG